MADQQAGPNDAQIRKILGKPKQGTGIEAFVVEITPAMAAALLGFNKNIRRLRESVVTSYMTDMILGGWVLTGEPIIFAKTADLKNGQHRLTASVRADVPFTTVVVLGVEPDVDLNMDRAAVRTFGDYLWKQGYDDAKNLAASIRLSYQLIKNGKVEQSPTLTNEMLARWFNDHKPLVDDLAVVRQWERRWPKGFTRNHGAAIRHAASFVSDVDVDDVDAFFKSLAYDSDIVKTRSAPHVLHRTFERMIASSKSGRIQIPMRVAVTIKALNAYLEGEDVTPQAISWRRGGKNPEEFPQITAGAMAEAVRELEAEDAET